MKKIVQVLGFGLIIITGFTSCQKNRECVCEKSYTKQDESMVVNDGTYTLRDNRRNASARCDHFEGSGSDMIGKYARNCAIQ